MVGHDTFCSLCGGPLTSVPRTQTDEHDTSGTPESSLQPQALRYYYDGKVLTAGMQEWLSDIRVFLRKGTSCASFTNAVAGSSCILTSPGGTATAGDVISVPLDPNNPDGQRKNIYLYMLRWSDPPNLPLHSTCWELLLCYLDHVRKDVDVDAVYAHLAAEFKLGVRWWEVEGRTSMRIPGLYPPHGFFGATRFWGENWNVRRGFEWVCANPIAVESLEDWYLAFIRSCQFPRTTCKPTAPVCGTSQEAGGFAQLPSELLYKIISYLPLPCVTSARLASRDMAALPLDTAFWRTRVLLPAVDVPWLWDVDLSRRSWEVGEEAGVDWRECLKQLVKAEAQHTLRKDEPVGLRSRRRIWRAMEACWGKGYP